MKKAPQSAGLCRTAQMRSLRAGLIGAGADIALARRIGGSTAAGLHVRTRRGLRRRRRRMMLVFVRLGFSGKGGGGEAGRHNHSEGKFGFVHARNSLELN